MNILIPCLILIILFNFSSSNKDAMTCGSTFKLVNQQSGDRLHSHDVKYGSGSGQQVKLIIHFKYFYYLFFSLLLVHRMLMM
jgi:dolichyl-phosphate-mannose--protein O-mannosyl transferase